MEHKITIQNAITVTRGGVEIAKIPATYDLGSCPPIYHLQVASLIQQLPVGFVEADQNLVFQKDEAGRVITNPDGSPKFWPKREGEADADQEGQPPEIPPELG